MGRSGETAPGATLIEVVVVLTLIGILLAAAVPNLRGAVYKAYATDVLGDVRVVQIAYAHYLAEAGGRPRPGRWGSVPPDFEPHLPDGFEFRTDLADYRLVRLRPRASPFGVESVELRVRPRRSLRPELIDALGAMANQTMTVKKRNHIRFYLVP